MGGDWQTAGAAMATVAFLLALFFAVVLGFAAHRGSICTVRAVAEAMHARTFMMFWSVVKSVLWIIAITLPIFALLPATAEAVGGWRFTAIAVAGGFIFGLGAGINGACAYSTMARLAEGEASMLVAVAGFAFGIFGFGLLVGGGAVARPSPAPALILSLGTFGLVVAALILAYGAYEIRRLWRTRPPGKSLRELVLARPYRLSTAALVMGISGALVFLLYGSAGYTSTFEVVIEGALGERPWPSTARWLLLVAVILGMFVSAVARGGLRFDCRPRVDWLRNVFGGLLMGLGAALTPGGNDVLVLYSLPSLSPHALPSYAALALGVIAAILFMRAVFGIEMRAEVKHDIFLTDWGLGRRSQKS
jgi:uncharacterized membrane protein YedE/YeeE